MVNATPLNIVRKICDKQILMVKNCNEKNVIKNFKYKFATVKFVMNIYFMTNKIWTKNCDNIFG